MRTRARGPARKPPGWIAQFAALVLPTECAGCGRADEAVCRGCRTALAARPHRSDPDAAGLPDGFPVWSGPAFDGVVRELVSACKDRGRRDALGPAAHVLAAIIACAITNGRNGPTATRYAVVPVPTRRTAVRRRGEDTLLVMARRACRTLRRAGIPANVAPVLRRTRRTRDQAGLGAAERARNMDRSMAARARAERHLRGSVVIVVDDVVTTGATLAEAVRALAASGCAASFGATVAATPRDVSP